MRYFIAPLTMKGYYSSAMETADRILEVRDLNIYKKENDEKIVDGLSLYLNSGESLGIVGESGSGKTMTLKSLIGLLPESVYDEYGFKEAQGHMGMIFQNPMKALDPIYPVAKQLREVYLQHHDPSTIGAAHEDAASRWIRMICGRLDLPEDILNKERYPHTLSGGQCQRVCIAMALACEPDILLCDEPTTALDMSVQKNTIELIKELKAEYGFSIIFVTHNLIVASKICTRLIVLKNGRIVEQGSTEKILTDPEHEYTKALVNSILKVPELKA